MESCGMTFKPSGVIVPTLLTSKPAKAERKEGTCQSHTPSVKRGLFLQGGQTELPEANEVAAPLAPESSGATNLA